MNRCCCDLQTGMEVIGFYREEITHVLQLVASVLKLGNVEFSHRSNSDGTDGCDISNTAGMYLAFYIHMYKKQKAVFKK